MYDFFIAYATPDRLQAQDLCWFLQDHSCEVLAIPIFEFGVCSRGYLISLL